MSSITHLSGIGILLLLLSVTHVNVSPLEHSGQHVTSSMASMANIKDNKSSPEHPKTDPISISISPTTWSSTNSPHSSTIHLNNKSSDFPLFRSIVTKTPVSPQKDQDDRKSIHYPQQRNSLSSRETITEVKRSADEFEFQLESPMSLASSSGSSTRVTGPYFESNKTVVSVVVRAGQMVMFDCAVVLLQGRTVSWFRKRKDNLQLLTVGNATYYSDSRLGLRFRYPNNWRLGIEMVQKSDEGEYHCQLSTHPPKALLFNLKVIAPTVAIYDENGHVVTERHYKVDSSLHLTCKASHVDKSVDNIVWLKGDRVLPGSDSRIKVKLTKNQGNGEATGYLSVLSVRKTDSGNITCRVSPMASSTIAVHVLNGELPAAVMRDSANSLLVLGGLSPFVWILSSLPLLISTPLLYPTSTLHFLS